MKAGGADPSAILDIVSDNLPYRSEDTRGAAKDIVDALEVGGYRIVRAGMVPRLEALEHTVEILGGAADMDLGSVNLRAARDTLRALTELAVVVLGLDPDDRDDPAGAEA